MSTALRTSRSQALTQRYLHGSTSLSQRMGGIFQCSYTSTVGVLLLRSSSTFILQVHYEWTTKSATSDWQSSLSICHRRRICDGWPRLTRWILPGRDKCRALCGGQRRLPVCSSLVHALLLPACKPAQSVARGQRPAGLFMLALPLAHATDPCQCAGVLQLSHEEDTYGQAWCMPHCLLYGSVGQGKALKTLSLFRYCVHCCAGWRQRTPSPPPPRTATPRRSGSRRMQRSWARTPGSWQWAATAQISDRVHLYPIYFAPPHARQWGLLQGWTCLC